jgi:hypothetical protein
MPSTLFTVAPVAASVAVGQGFVRCKDGAGLPIDWSHWATSPGQLLGLYVQGLTVYVLVIAKLAPDDRKIAPGKARAIKPSAIFVVFLLA